MSILNTINTPIGISSATASPGSGDNISTGYVLGQEWYNTTTGDKFYHKFDGVWVKYENSSTSALTEVTYAELVALIGSSSLVPYRTYLLTDYETVYEQPESFEIISSGVIEPLYITATDINKLHNVCRSNLYPNDIVYYEITGDTGDSYGTEGFTKGKIYRRIDTIGNNDIGTDWRHIKYRRWALNVNNPWVIHNSYVKGDIVNDGNNIYICVNDVLDSLTLSSDWFLYPAINGEYASIYSTGSTLRLLGSNYTIPVDSLDYQDSYMFSLDFTDTESFCNNKIETYYLNNNVILSPSFNNNNIGGRFRNNYIKRSFYSNDIVYGFSTNIINGEMYYNNIMSPFVENIITEDEFSMSILEGYEVFGNVFNGMFRDNTIGRMYSNYLNSFTNNFINSTFRDNSFQGGFSDNTCDVGGYIEFCKSFNASSIYNNVFNAYFRYNDINGSFDNNTLNALIDTNTFQNYFEYNNVNGESFVNNNIGIYFVGNKIDGVFDDNIIGNYFKSNKIGTYFTNNIIGDSFGGRFLDTDYKGVGNTIGSNFQYNTTTGAFYGNVIGSRCGYVHGSTMSGNNFGTGFVNNSVADDIINLDFTPYTELYNKEYRHEIYRVPDNTLQYKWQDNFGDINIEKIV